MKILKRKIAEYRSNKLDRRQTDKELMEEIDGLRMHQPHSSGMPLDHYFPQRYLWHPPRPYWSIFSGVLAGLCFMGAWNMFQARTEGWIAGVSGFGVVGLIIVSVGVWGFYFDVRKRELYWRAIVARLRAQLSEIQGDANENT